MRSHSGSVVHRCWVQSGRACATRSQSPETSRSPAAATTTAPASAPSNSTRRAPLRANRIAASQSGAISARAGSARSSDVSDFVADSPAKPSSDGAGSSAALSAKGRPRGFAGGGSAAAPRVFTLRWSMASGSASARDPSGRRCHSPARTTLFGAPVSTACPPRGMMSMDSPARNSSYCNAPRARHSWSADASKATRRASQSRLQPRPLFTSDSRIACSTTATSRGTPSTRFSPESVW
mmetsp:Transcript_3249/g.11178  ORF Transcript_3249/g.11178 Transcript_3249/m.11178 type:complete len:238 (-) Transcript_3249:556-1269(-)